MLKLINLIFIVLSLNCSAQYTWQWTELDTMPFRTANNAVCEAFVGGDEYVYSFGGIDLSKSFDGIHQNSFKFDVQSGTWSTISSLPDTLGKIAMGASYVKGKIYIIGGYHVFPNGSELSSDKVHIYNPASDTYEVDGAPIPVPIDDHVQCVYKDSLIYVVTGWSNTTNYPNVQIYNPTFDSWTAGTSVPNTGYFKSFGSSGYIIGDTLYYHGGVTSGNFSAQPFMRKGYINPNDPTDVTWELMDDAPGASGYRSACSGSGNTIFWVGGAPTAYNYDGIAYNGSGGVDPSARILHFNNWNFSHVDEVSQPYGVMDLRGIAKLDESRWIICGGMDTNQVVSNRTFLLENGLVKTSEIEVPELEVVYNFDQTITISSPVNGEARLFRIDGGVVSYLTANSNFEINGSELDAGTYLFVQGDLSVIIRI